MYRDYLDSGNNPGKIYAPDRVLPKGETPFRDEYEEYIREYPTSMRSISASIPDAAP